MDARRMNPTHARIAFLEALGSITQGDIAELVGVHRRTVEKVLSRDDVKAEVERLREAGTLDTEAEVAIRRAMLAVTANGQPDHKTRIQAAKMLAELPRFIPTEHAHPPVNFRVTIAPDLSTTTDAPQPTYTAADGTPYTPPPGMKVVLGAGVWYLEPITPAPDEPIPDTEYYTGSRAHPSVQPA